MIVTVDLHSVNADDVVDVSDVVAKIGNVQWRVKRPRVEQVIGLNRPRVHLQLHRIAQPAAVTPEASFLEDAVLLVLPGRRVEPENENKFIKYAWS